MTHMTLDPPRPLRIHLVSTAPVNPTVGTGVAVASGNLARELRARGFAMVDPLNRPAAGWSLTERVARNRELVPPDNGVLLCIDFDGFTIPGRRGGGRAWKAVHVRTNFLELLRIAPHAAHRELEIQAQLLLENLATADMVIASSQHSLTQLTTSHLSLPSRRLVLPNALDHELANHLERLPVAASTEPLIVAYGRATWRKDFATAVRASAKLARAGVAHQFDLMTGGPDRARLGALIDRLAATQIRVLDLTPSRAAVARLLRRAWVVCHPSLQEDFGNVFIEAAAAGVPIVAARIPVAVEHQIDRGAGALVPAGDAGAFARAMERVLLTRVARPGRQRRLPTRYGHLTWDGVGGMLAEALVALARGGTDQ